MYYYLYQITNKVNGKIYVGVHKTTNLDDGYMGSGKIIRRAVEKHGITNFSKVILETFENAEAMYAREKEVVTDEFLLREDVYNLRRGGHGGFDHINKNEELRIAKNRKARAITNSKIDIHEVSRKGGLSRIEKYPTLSSEVAKRGHDEGWFSFRNKNHSDETKKKIGKANAKHQSGDKNSQFGSMWITNGIENRKIKKDDPTPGGWRKGRVMRG